MECKRVPAVLILVRPLFPMEFLYCPELHCQQGVLHVREHGQSEQLATCQGLQYVYAPVISSSNADVIFEIHLSSALIVGRRETQII